MVKVEGWERRNKKLEDEIAALRAEKDEMAFILEAHRSSCKLQGDVVSEVMVKVEPPTLEANPETEFVQVQVVEPTPLVTSILTPIKMTSNLNTPTCGTQHKSSLIFTPLFSPNTEATLLTSLYNKKTFIQSMYIIYIVNP